MSSYTNSSLYEPRKIVVNRYWKRPKPKVYECNVRDAERFYQESYKDYLKSKEFATSRPQPSHARSIEDEFASKWGQHRANLNLDSSLSDPFIRNRREGSLGTYGSDGGAGLESSYRKALNTYGRSEEEYGGRSSNRASSLMNNRGQSPDVEIQSIDDRLDRLKKLRDELGLPAEGEHGTSPSATGSKSILKSSRHQSPGDMRVRGAESSRMYSSSRGDSRSRANDFSNDYDERVQAKTEKSTRFARQFSGGDDKYRQMDRLPKENGKFSQAADDSLEKYSVRNYMRTSERKPVGDGSDYSYKLSSDSKSSSRRFGGSDGDETSSYKFSSDSKLSSMKNASALADDDAYKPSESKYSRSKYAAGDDSSAYQSESKSTRVKSSRTETADDVPDYDDEFLSSLRKKFPTSDEIIDKINKMEVE